MKARRAWNARYTKIMMIAAFAVVVPGAVASTDAVAKTTKFGQRTIRPGMKGQDVETLQENLGRLGFNIPADGEYGPQTVAAVKRFQKTEELPVNGVFSRHDALVLRKVVVANAAELTGGAEANPALPPAAR
ncbi:MAG: peptidoglycan-binding protein, partial [Solirubrobacteraceae bacterium]